MAREEAGATIASAPAVRRRGPFYALTFRNFRLFFVGQIVSVVGTWMQNVAQQWLVWSLTHDPLWLGIISWMSAIPYVLFFLWGGHVADRHSRRTILVWTQAVMMLLAFVLALLATNRWLPVQAWHVAVLTALSGIVNAFNMPAQQAFVSDLVEDREALSNAIALNSLRFNLARMLGPMLAGLTLVKFSVAACFFLNGLSFLAVIASLLMMRLPHFTPHAKRLSVWGGFGYIWRDKKVFRTVALVAAGSLLAWPVSTLYPVFAARFHAGVGGFSGMMSANGVGAMLGGILLTICADRLPRRLLVYGGLVLFCAALLLFAAAPGYWLALVFLVLSGFAMILFGTSSNTRVQEEVPDALRGRVMAVYSLVFNGLMPVGSLYIGFLAKHLGASAAIDINALLCLTFAMALLAWSWADQRRVARSLQPGEAQ
jgi:MFS family permease